MGKFVNMNSHSEKQNQSNETQSNPSSNELRLLGKRIVNEIKKSLKNRMMMFVKSNWIFNVKLLLQ